MQAVCFKLKHQQNWSAMIVDCFLQNYAWMPKQELKQWNMQSVSNFLSKNLKANTLYLKILISLSINAPTALD